MSVIWANFHSKLSTIISSNGIVRERERQKKKGKRYQDSIPPSLCVFLGNEETSVLPKVLPSCTHINSTFPITQDSSSQNRNEAYVSLCCFPPIQCVCVRTNVRTSSVLFRLFVRYLTYSLERVYLISLQFLLLTQASLLSVLWLVGWKEGRAWAQFVEGSCLDKKRGEKIFAVPRASFSPFQT